MAARKRKRNAERRARIADIKNDKTKGAGLYRVERGRQTGRDASSRRMPDPNKGAKKKGNGKGNGDGRGKPADGNGTRFGGRKHLAAGVQYLMKKSRDSANTKQFPKPLTRTQAATRAKRNIMADRGNRTYKGPFDWARDGLAAKDVDMGTRLNNVARKRMGVRKNVTIRANLKNAPKMGTGRVLYKRKATT